MAASFLAQEVKTKLGLIAGVWKETLPRERRVAVTPSTIGVLIEGRCDRVAIEQDAGKEPGFLDADYAAKGAATGLSAGDVRDRTQILLQVRVPSSNWTG